eukprot:scaffold22490_cov31-Attheya_sp.AAC.1
MSVLNLVCPPSQQPSSISLYTVVTGGSRGIGRATCLLLASRGYDVAVNYQSNAKGAQVVVTDIEAARGHAR